MQNKLKPATTGAIKVLNEANVRTIMATGDNVLTAISVARECQIIQSDACVFIGDLKREGGIDTLFWTSTGTEKLNFDGKDLEPKEEHEKKSVNEQVRESALNMS